MGEPFQLIQDYQTIQRGNTLEDALSAHITGNPLR